MAHHAYFVAGERAAAVAAARSFAEQELGEGVPGLDIVDLSFELFSVDDSRRLIDTASVSGIGGKKVIIASITRIFHEAQNALLKILEEPPEGTSIILCIPSEGILLSTLRSRLLPIQNTTGVVPSDGWASRFLEGSASEREKLVAKLVEQSKSDKEETKQQARRNAIELLQGLTEAVYAHLHAAKAPADKDADRQTLTELASFMPVLYERSAPLKLIFEHLLLVIPKDLAVPKV